MKKTIVMIAALMAMMLMSGCTNQPIPTASGGQSKSSFMSGIETELMTGKITLLSWGKTEIYARDGSTITFVPNPPTLANQNNPF